MKHLIHLLALLSVLIVPSRAETGLIPPAGIVQTEGNSHTIRPPGKLIGDAKALDYSTPMGAADGWHTASGTTATFVITFAAPVTLTQFHLWNYNHATSWTLGVKDFTLETSKDAEGETFHPAGSFAAKGVANNATVESFPLRAEGVRRVRWKILNNHGFKGAVGASEIGFSGKRPPGAFPALGAGLLLPEKPESFHVFLLMGQSNMAGAGELKLGDTAPVAGVVVLDGQGTIASAEPMEPIAWRPGAHRLHLHQPSAQFGLGMDFAKTYLALHPGVTVGLIPCAWGGAGIERLKKGTPIFSNAMTRLRFARQRGVIKGVLWHQGESDTVARVSVDTYEGKLRTLMVDVRAEANDPHLPFVIGNLAEFYGQSPEHSARLGQINEIREILHRVATEDPDVVFVPSTGLVSLDAHFVHFNRASLVTFGQRYAELLTQFQKGAVSPARATDAQIAPHVFATQAHSLQFTLDQTGQFTGLKNGLTDEDLLHLQVPSRLMGLKLYGNPAILQPSKLEVVSSSDNKTVLRLTFDARTSVDIQVTSREGWFRFQTVAATNLNGIERIEWGPYNTRCEGPVGEFFGLVRSEKTTLGLMSLEPNTDGIGNYSESAFWLPMNEGGSFLRLSAEDHSQPRQVELRRYVPVPGLTVIGSAVALYAVPRGQELPLIKRIATSEGLPVPQFRGQWAKESAAILSPSLWASFTESSADNALKLAEKFSAGELCGGAGIFGNWGHFDLDPKFFPSGLSGIRAIGERAAKRGVVVTMYTLTDFLRPLRIAEPFLAPKPDARLARFDEPVTLLTEIPESGSFAINRTNNIERLLRMRTPALLVGDELIEILGSELSDGKALVTKSTRGFYSTPKQPHQAGDHAQFMNYNAYQNFFPGDLSLCFEVAENIGRVAREGNFDKVTLDGHESATQTGHGLYAMNQTAKIIYEANAGRNLMMTSSRITNYCWHLLSYITWGEHDHAKGFRGTMLDARVLRQFQLQRSLMPHKMGQYYPDRTTTAEDIGWLMGVACGWDSGVDFSNRANNMDENPQAEEVFRLVQVWEKARLSGKLTAEQKMRLRQVDCVYRPQKKPDGAWDIQLIRRWRHEGVVIGAPADIKMKVLTGDAHIVPQSADIDLLHSPLVAKEAWLSDDLVFGTGQPHEVELNYPALNTKGVDPQKLQFVLRVPQSAAAGIENPRFTVNGKSFAIPCRIEPGQYMSLPLDSPMAYLYDHNHQVVQEIPLRHTNNLPTVKRGTPFTVQFSAEPAVAGARTEAILNFYAFQPIPIG